MFQHPWRFVAACVLYGLCTCWWVTLRLWIFPLWPVCRKYSALCSFPCCVCLSLSSSCVTQSGRLSWLLIWAHRCTRSSRSDQNLHRRLGPGTDISHTASAPPGPQVTPSLQTHVTHQHRLCLYIKHVQIIQLLNSLQNHDGDLRRCSWWCWWQLKFNDDKGSTQAFLQNKTLCFQSNKANNFNSSWII